MITRILVANRGEVVSRVARTASSMGITTVGVYADSDAEARYLDDVDIAVALGDDQASSPYLDISKLIDAARRTGADAVHPGYGFLAENADFARAVADAGLTWIGPPPAAIESMGSKIEAKKIAADAGVEVLDGVTVTDDSPAVLDAIRALPLPLLVKPSAGGGGKGMVLVEDHTELERALQSARRGAEAAFGDGALFVEHYFAAPRHVEVQILADSHGRVIALGDRDCSVQRRHQKIVEEAPALPTAPPESREQMQQAAVELARHIGYTGAGTVEFLAFDGGYAFLEMNTRLQVEHAVTEEITGIDLVEWQIRIARGEALDVDPEARGHSIEVRLYAEDPANDYLPSPGVITEWAHTDVPGVRWEEGVETGSRVSTRYDPMIAKIVAYGADRDEAIARLRAALRGLQVSGIKTNRDLLLGVLGDDEFTGGPVGTDFLERRDELLKPEPDTAVVERAAIATAIHRLLLTGSEREVQPFAPVGWRNLPSQDQLTTLRTNGSELVVHARRERDGTWRAGIDGADQRVVVRRHTTEAIALEIDGLRTRFAVADSGQHTTVQTPDGAVEFTALTGIEADEEAGLAGNVLAPLPGLVVSLEVAVGDTVELGDALVVLEAMKMEHRLEATGPGKVTEVLVAVGDSVDYQAPLVVVEED
ncbi:ATP-grasp domain-containing protein [Epidermidibacterium keratini]|uniref:biotin carboxylase n=1 Tax=Epidermidibacterium keratini TaxID=1891644 RepID=A0A7L4YM14_9ACTN|nr:biotin carboxylase N-terminal domain-containing protein [Epidermidibacterium keratini]QHC00325.1 ATP-grasp domain-containing protein [Epidermidibacterium keratini]